jgi:hypothetical protein
VRESLTRGDLRPLEGEPIRRFLEALPEEHRCALLIDMVELWASHGAGDVLLKTLAEVTGI